MICKNNSEFHNTRLDINFRLRSLYYLRYSIWLIGTRPITTVGSNRFKVRHWVFPIDKCPCRSSLWTMWLSVRFTIKRFVEKIKSWWGSPWLFILFGSNSTVCLDMTTMKWKDKGDVYNYLYNMWHCVISSKYR